MICRFKVPIDVITMTVTWCPAPHYLVRRNQHFWGTYCLHLQNLF